MTAWATCFAASGASSSTVSARELRNAMSSGESAITDHSANDVRSRRSFLSAHFPFHAVTADAILRHNGVDTGRKNNLGDMPFREAV